MTASVTEQLAEWIVKARYDDVPEVGSRRVEERFIDSLGVQFAGMSVSTGQIITKWVRAQGATPESSVVGGGFKTTASLATLANATAGHALEFDDIATFSGHYANPLTAAALAVGEKLGASGRDVILAWLVGYEVICQTAKPCMDGPRNTLLWRGWFNQGFQPVLGVAALTAKLLGLDVDPDPDGARQRGIGHGRGDEEPGQRHQIVHAPGAQPCTASLRRSWRPGLHRQRGHHRRRRRRGPDARPRGRGPQKVLDGLGNVGHGDAGVDHAAARIVRCRALGPGRPAAAPATSGRSTRTRSSRSRSTCRRS